MRWKSTAMMFGAPFVVGVLSSEAIKGGMEAGNAVFVAAYLGMMVGLFARILNGIEDGG